MDIYTLRRRGAILIMAIAAAMVGVFLYLSSRMVAELESQERERMELWADATRRLAASTAAGADIDFMLRVIETNRTIPVLLTDADGRMLFHRNFTLPEPADTLGTAPLSAANAIYLHEQVGRMRADRHVIDIEVAPGTVQHLYYDDSRLLHRLHYYPYLQLLLMAAFVVIVYFAVTSTKRAEQNKVWVGLSKETAHQLGTPISSLMAWLELIRDQPDEAPMAVEEMQKDVDRLESIASRFSKIGSAPELEDTVVGPQVEATVDYMRRRLPSAVTITFTDTSHGARSFVSTPLLGWVLENLIKNAVDAMQGRGSIAVSVTPHGSLLRIEVADSGCGIPKRMRRSVFRPGYTTKSRGWGLGLTLARRIIDTYHYGRITIAASATATDSPGATGTTFRIELPLVR